MRYPCHGFDRQPGPPETTALSSARRWATAVLCAGAQQGVGYAQEAAPPTPEPQGNVEQGRRWLLQRHETGCILCHEVTGIAQGGQIGPPLRDLGHRYSTQALSARIADARQFNPQTVMPPYRSTAGLQHVAPPFQGKPVLTAQALADIVSYLLSSPAEPTSSPPSRPNPPALPSP